MSKLKRIQKRDDEMAFRSRKTKWKLKSIGSANCSLPLSGNSWMDLLVVRSSPYIMNDKLLPLIPIRHWFRKSFSLLLSFHFFSAFFLISWSFPLFSRSAEQRGWSFTWEGTYIIGMCSFHSIQYVHPQFSWVNGFYLGKFYERSFVL